MGYYFLARFPGLAAAASGFAAGFGATLGVPLAFALGLNVTFFGVGMDLVRTSSVTESCVLRRIT